jgi:L-ribulose-5-phosphate 4-epimerase
MNPPHELLELSRELGDPVRKLAMLAEGNTSIRTGDSFWIKASGRSLCGAGDGSFVRVAFGPLLSALDKTGLSDADVQGRLKDSLLDGPDGARPSVEAFMHAWLLTLPDVQVVGHCHPESLLSILCLKDAEVLAKRRMFPDEVVCCGIEACWVPYRDPGLALAVEVRSRVEEFSNRLGERPKTIWLQNHGLICAGSTAQEVLSATLMQDKGARVLLQALQSGREPRFLTPDEAERIRSRPDEHYRQKLLWSQGDAAS